MIKDNVFCVQSIAIIID